MFTSIFLGFSLGLSVCLPVGPINVLILNYAVSSLKSALAIGFGAAICDAVYLLIFSLLSSQLSGAFADALGICGFCILLYMALGIARSQPAAPAQDGTPAQEARLGLQLGKGFLINALNPYVLAFWLGMGPQVSTDAHPLAFALSLSGACFLWVVALSTVVSKFARFLRPKILRAINLVSAAVLIFFAFKLLFFTSFLQPVFKDF